MPSVSGPVPIGRKGLAMLGSLGLCHHLQRKFDFLKCERPVCPHKTTVVLCDEIPFFVLVRGRLACHDDMPAMFFRWLVGLGIILAVGVTGVLAIQGHARSGRPIERWGIFNLVIAESKGYHLSPICACHIETVGFRFLETEDPLLKTDNGLDRRGEGFLHLRDRILCFPRGGPLDPTVLRQEGHVQRRHVLRVRSTAYMFKDILLKEGQQITLDVTKVRDDSIVHYCMSAKDEGMVIDFGDRGCSRCSYVSKAGRRRGIGTYAVEVVVVRRRLAVLVHRRSESFSFVKVLSGHGIPHNAKPIIVVESVPHVDLGFRLLDRTIRKMGNEFRKIVIIDLLRKTMRLYDHLLASSSRSWQRLRDVRDE